MSDFKSYDAKKNELFYNLNLKFEKSKPIIMKKIYTLIVLIFFFISSQAQKDTTGLSLPIKDGKLVYEEVISIPEKKQKDLYNNAISWFIDYFKDSKEVIQNQDKDMGRIYGKGMVRIYSKISGVTLEYPNLLTIQIDAKDEKFRYRIYDMNMSTETQVLNGFGVLKGRKFTPEDLISNLTNGTNIVLTKSGSRKALEGINQKIIEIKTSLISAMKKTDDF